MTTITNTNPLATQGGTAVLSTSQAKAGDNPFLKLLTEQLRNQTPLEPVDNQSFMSQMASYTTMQEQRDLNTNLLKLLDYQGVLARVQGLGEGSALLGKEVTYAGEDGETATGAVESVFVAETGDVRLRLAGGKEIDMRSVLGISAVGATTGTNPSTPTGATSGSAAAAAGAAASNSA
jgi:flagellar basal-body rod modification protein FlgD